ncbi:hypothetical protein Prudu_005767 [Prunus dulcis]|uniref:Uncharacterized protein n=1 Tax=Prunus dulcis TaxID=3755 RepID=A0A4Y1QYD0_PRUDU|nr:hypothetical protein Prudu_005767 [Prunus dulcis]
MVSSRYSPHLIGKPLLKADDAIRSSHPLMFALSAFNLLMLNRWSGFFLIVR